MPQPKSTTALLKQLRLLMQDVKVVPEPLNAYIVPSGDAHNNEYLPSSEARRAFITGFTGSEGAAIVTGEHACLWTDGRYYLQASQQMDENWTLMKEGLPSTPTRGKWLSKTLPAGSKIGADPQLVTYFNWVPLKTELEQAGHKLVPVPINLIDSIWLDKPKRPANPVKPLPLKFSGKTVGEKLKEIREQMTEKKAEVLVVTALDEVAWVLNLRGSDIPYNPVFFSFVIVEKDKLRIFIDKDRYTKEIEDFLASEAPYETIKVEPYENVNVTLSEIVKNLRGSAWLSPKSSFSLVNLIPKEKLLSEITPICLMKAVKNPTEIRGMRNAHIKDAAALCCYFDWLEKNIDKENVTEISGAKKLEEFRALQEDFVGPSFDTISSVGAHGAIIHYSPDENTDVRITRDEVYLCDSGGQYLDGTTDVTRTIHLGSPSAYERECYTYVLKGQLQLGSMIFPTKTKGNYLDAFARKYLWEVGLDYAHGTGHGVGSYLNVHEGPMGITWRPMPDDPGLDEGMFLSNEPGYYEEGKFGFRIEDIVQVVKADTKNNFNDRGFLTFDTITLVPKQLKLTAVEMLTDKEIELLNAFHLKCRDVVGPLLERRGFLEAKEWLWRETVPIVRKN